ncbi:hypothetical protein [Pseudonocardia hydrocarbonoxydans]|uniref:Uncharacterized protein n=1 Tax=Pseudonocardia hydrocarbonoxydans TaxID=76726 RepID=A0A4Y3WUW4_9PSEU|nr:hypothetical protein [Pseudonocardia hydrocarbonoxydans]GEC22677.1 hypothetical protein PHY01_49600 [Pseudonocardia hydrocarbonoxydans]
MTDRDHRAGDHTAEGRCTSGVAPQDAQQLRPWTAQGATIDTAHLRICVGEDREEDERREQLARWHTDDARDVDARCDGDDGPEWIVCDDGPGLP